MNDELTAAPPALTEEDCLAAYRQAVLYHEQAQQFYYRAARAYEDAQKHQEATHNAMLDTRGKLGAAERALYAAIAGRGRNDGPVEHQE